MTKDSNKPDSASNNLTHFGFQDVAVEKKSSLVKGVFNSVASKYDVMNDAMSLGTHRLWKKKLIQMINPQARKKLLDVAGGTGDISFEFLRKCPEASVTICDINENMLFQGRNRAVDKGYIKPIEWLCGDAENLPVPDRHYDYYTIAFGIRNVTHIDQALKEAYRVLKPGGQFFCLEFSKVTNAVLRRLYKLYSFQVIPKMGKLLTGDSDSYQYLVESIRKFPDQGAFKQKIEDAGFSHVTYTNLSSGVVAIHTGWRI